MKRSILGSALALVLVAPALAAEKSLEQAVTEARLESQINTAFMLNRHLDAFEIGVDVEGSTAILTGTVDEAIDKELAENVALNAKGITKVDNRIAVDQKVTLRDRAGDNLRDFGEAVEDASITAAVKSRLLWNDTTDGLDINVDTLNGRVSLSGTANSQAEKDLAARLALGTGGVRSVDNKLVVSAGKSATDEAAATAEKAAEDIAASAEKAAESAGETISDGWITTKVKSSLLMAKYVDGLDLTVDTKDGVVTLGGSASTKAERDLAISIASDIKGVKRVDANGVRIGA